MFFRRKRHKEENENATTTTTAKEKEQFQKDAQDYVIMQLIDEFAENLAPFGYSKANVKEMFLKTDAPDFYVREPEDKRNSFIDKAVIISFRCKTRRHAPEHLIDYVRIMHTQGVGEKDEYVFISLVLKYIQYNLLINLWRIEKNEKRLRTFVSGFWNQAMKSYASQEVCEQMIEYVFLSEECFDDTIKLLKSAKTIEL